METDISVSILYGPLVVLPTWPDCDSEIPKFYVLGLKPDDAIRGLNYTLYKEGAELVEIGWLTTNRAHISRCRLISGCQVD